MLITWYELSEWDSFKSYNTEIQRESSDKSACRGKGIGEWKHVRLTVTTRGGAIIV